MEATVTYHAQTTADTKTCHIQNGTCFACEAGYKGTICATGIFCFAYLLMKDNYQYYFYYFVELFSGSFLL